jgi:hypothetical protein
MLCLVHHYASWHAFHPIKPRIIYIRVVYTSVLDRVDQASEKVSSTRGVDVKLDFYEN